MSEEEICWLRIVSEENDSQYNGMYLRMTGSGSNVVIATKEPPKFLGCHSDEKGSQVFTSWKHPERKWSLRLIDRETIESLRKVPTNTNLPSWSSVEIIGEEQSEGDQGFVFGGNPPKLTHPSCKGWIICKWAYGYPQLFYLTEAYDESKPLPDFCERVSLVKEEVKGQGEEKTV